MYLVISEAKYGLLFKIPAAKNVGLQTPKQIERIEQGTNLHPHVVQSKVTAGFWLGASLPMLTLLRYSMTGWDLSCISDLKVFHALSISLSVAGMCSKAG